MNANPLASDLDDILERTPTLWQEFRGQRIFITGGTGFFGCWLLESLLWANCKLQLNARVVVLSRNPAAFGRKAPHLAGDPAVTLHTGDVRDFRFPAGEFSHVIHAAAEVAGKAKEADPREQFDVIVDGTQRALEFAAEKNVSKFLLTSSGAVCGAQPPELHGLREDYAGGPDLTKPRSSYGEARWAAELMCTQFHQRHGLAAKIARGFAFVGPYLPLEGGLAMGNFIRDGIQGGPIIVTGDGTPFRSYMYASDLVVWLWTILVGGRPAVAYNVGAEQAVTIGELARLVAKCLGGRSAVQIVGTPQADVPAERYIPCTERARRELGLECRVDLESGIQKTIAWARRHREF